MKDANPVIGLLLFVLCFGSWPLFLFTSFQSHPRRIFIAVSLSLATFIIASYIATFCVPLRSTAPLYLWLALPYLLISFRFVRRRHISQATAGDAEPRSESSTMHSTPPRFLPYAILTGLLVLAALVISQTRSRQTLRNWNSTPGALGMERPLTLSLERHVAGVDGFGGVPTYQLNITDGGYFYVHDLPIPRTDSPTFAQGCRVVWETNKIDFIMPSGVTLTFPAQVVIQQIGAR